MKCVSQHHHYRRSRIHRRQPAAPHPLAGLALGDLPNAERYYTVDTSIWNQHTHARVWALEATETGLLRWKLGNHTDALKMWRSALPILHTVNSACTTKALSKVRTAATELFTSTEPHKIPHSDQRRLRRGQQPAGYIR